MSNPLLELYLNKLTLTTIASQYSNIIDKNSKSDSITILTKLFIRQFVDIPYLQ